MRRRKSKLNILTSWQPFVTMPKNPQNKVASSSDSSNPEGTVGMKHAVKKSRGTFTHIK